jgi:hypothetical protein
MSPLRRSPRCRFCGSRRHNLETCESYREYTELFSGTVTAEELEAHATDRWEWPGPHRLRWEGITCMFRERGE